MISGRAVERSSDCSAYLCSLSKFILRLDAGSGLGSFSYDLKRITVEKGPEVMDPDDKLR